MSPDRLAAALSYRSRGWAVLPIQARGKEPHFATLERVHGVSTWKPLADRPASEPEIRAWFEHDPDANVGILLGQPSGGLVVADIDRPDQARGLQHPPTVIAQAHRGPHLYLAAAGPVTTTTTPWGELRGDGSYVVAAPSVHESGHEYAWLVAPEEAELAALVLLQSEPPQSGAGTQSEVPLTVYPEGDAPSSSSSVATIAGDGSALARLDNAVMAALATMGVHAKLGAKFSCVLPGHGPDRHPSANMLRGHDGVWRYRDWHHRPEEPELLTLAEVRASRGAGRVVQLRGPTQSQWYRRVFHEAGVLLADPVTLAVPDGCSRLARHVADGFALLLALRDLRDGGPAPYTRSFAAPWCGIGERQAGEAIIELVRAGVLVKAGRHGSLNLYEPAAVASEGRVAA